MTFSNENWQEWFIASQLNNMLNIISNQQECQPRNRYTVQVAWKPPPPTVLKLKTDGSSLGNPGQSGFGGVIRDSQRDWIIGYTDSKLTLDLISGEITTCHPYAALLTCIRSYKGQNWSISFALTFREGNHVADWMAKKGASSEESLQLWDSCPPTLDTILFSDAIGITVPRLV
ncbi:uncharacterized protein LOC114420733 [Glycine soja]|nr:uncharacterized protein LOC114420733 [Glycine soja]